MKQKLRKGKSATKGRTAARLPAGKSSKTGKSAKSGETRAEVALSTLLALLHADRWLFEAAELAKKGGLKNEHEDFNRIRLELVQSLNRLQPRAYGAMLREGRVVGVSTP